jgi:hypothetical protein
MSQSPPAAWRPAATPPANMSASASTPTASATYGASSKATTAARMRLPEFGRTHVSVPRCWAWEGAGNYGAGHSAFLDE